MDSPRAIFLLPCNFFPNRTLIHAITYTNIKKSGILKIASDVEGGEDISF